MPYPPKIYFNDAQITRTPEGFSIELRRSNNQSEDNAVVGILYMGSLTAFHLSLALRESISNAIEKLCEGSSLKPEELRKSLEDKSRSYIDFAEILKQESSLGFQAPRKR